MSNIHTHSAETVNSETAGIELFDFHNFVLEVVDAEGVHYVVLARLCEPFELDVGGQRRKVERLPWARWKIIYHHDASGRKQELFCLDIRSVAGWLFTLNAGKIASYLRETLALFQCECADALADRFLGKRGATAPVDISAIRAALREEMTQELAALRAEMAALRVPMMQGPAIGNGAAAMYILAPLREVARIQAKALKSETPATIKRLRFNAERALRDAVHFPMFAGQTWAAFPHARLGDAQCAILRMLGEARRLADVATPKATQLALTGPAKAAVSLAVDNTRKAVTP